MKSLQLPNAPSGTPHYVRRAASPATRGRSGLERVLSSPVKRSEMGEVARRAKHDVAEGASRRRSAR